MKRLWPPWLPDIAAMKLACNPQQLLRFAGIRVEDKSAPGGVREVEHVVDGTRERVERTITDPFTRPPVVFDEADRRALIENGVIHVVGLRIGRDHKIRQAWTVTATPLRMCRSRWAGKRSICAIATLAGAGKRVHGCCGLVDDGAHLMVIPAIG